MSKNPVFIGSPNRHGGLQIVHETIKNAKIKSIIRKILQRKKQAKYSSADILLSWIYAIYCKSRSLEVVSNATNNLVHDLSKIRGLQVPSADTIGRYFKDIATITEKNETTEKINRKGKLVRVVHEINVNQPLNDLLLEVATTLGVINPKSTENTWDLDGSIFQSWKRDTKWTYKDESKERKIKGYQPSFSFINCQPVSIEGRNGNSPARYRMMDQIQRDFTSFQKFGIKPKRFRSDAAAYQQDIMDFMEEKEIEYFIRIINKRGRGFTEFIGGNKFQEVEIHNKIVKVTSCYYPAFNTNYKKNTEVKTYRVVVKALENENGNPEYFGVITNNITWTDKQVLEFYDDRQGKVCEGVIKQLKNDFAWKRMPFCEMSQNMVYLYIGAIAKIIYQYILARYNGKVDFLRGNMTLTTFYDKIICKISMYSEKGELSFFDFQATYDSLKEPPS